MSNNPASSAAMQLGGIFTALVGTMPFESLLSPANSHGYSAADMNAVVGEANARIKLLNDRVRRLKSDGAKAVNALQDEAMQQAEYIIHLETKVSVLEAALREMEQSTMPRPSNRNVAEPTTTKPGYKV